MSNSSGSLHDAADTLVDKVLKLCPVSPAAKSRGALRALSRRCQDRCNSQNTLTDTVVQAGGRGAALQRTLSTLELVDHALCSKLDKQNALLGPHQVEHVRGCATAEVWLKSMTHWQPPGLHANA